MIGTVRRFRRLALAIWNLGFRVAKRWSPSNSVTSCPPGLGRACLGRYSLAVTVAAVSDTEVRITRETEAAVRAFAPRVVAVAASITPRMMLSLSSVNGQKIVACVPTNSLLLAIKGVGQSGGRATDRIFDA